MKISHVTTRVLSTPADNPLVVGLPAPTDTRAVRAMRGTTIMNARGRTSTLTRLATGAFVLVFAWPFEGGGLIAWAFGLVGAAALILVFLRFGLLALIFCNFFAHLLELPLTTDSSAWYAGTSLFLLLALAALAIYGFRIALAGRPMFSGAGLDD